MHASKLKKKTGSYLGKVKIKLTDGSSDSRNSINPWYGWSPKGTKTLQWMNENEFNSLYKN